MTSLERLLGRPVSLQQVEEEIIRSFARVFASKHAGDYEICSNPKQASRQ
jgi:hypothetical protein